MKLKAKIKGSKVHDVGYRSLLMAGVLGLGIQRFSAQNRMENGEQAVIVLVEGEDKQIAEFRDFVENNIPDRALVSAVTFEDYDGHIMTVSDYSQLNLNEQLNKGIPALLRIDEKRDTTITILKEVKENTSAIRIGISSLRKDTSETLFEKYEELSREIAEIKAHPI
jgi:acylphosphatase